MRSFAGSARDASRGALAVGLLLVLSTLTSCAGNDDGDSSKAETRPLATQTAHPCQHLKRAATPAELHGEGDVSLWGLVLAAIPIRAGDEVKIVWRMTGSGSMSLRAVSPRGQVVPLVWGPEPHASSSYHRPGDEWGAGYRFTSPGCWRLHAERDDAEADVWLYVAA